MDEVAFSLKTYKFSKASLDFNIPDKANLVVSFNPIGTYSQSTGVYQLHFDVLVECKETNSNVLKVTCEASFKFNKSLKLDEIPIFFYPNSLAILFPYVRAFVSTLSLQANVRPVMLPTINLMGLTDTLRENTSAVD